ncbi:MAG: prepilin-type N-terminal cleavage/methylation domain-containing protein [Candidatus Taylorbacteria bacterium]|nr:prepilin-type N-terminal cleavage/methylation domain-containing protein [Candidatus Taylorbacteria bacterium]
MRGFTLIEMLIVIGVISLLAAFSFSTFVSYKGRQSVAGGREIVTAVLNDARTQTLASKFDSQYGVRLATTTITLFRGANYDPATTTNKVYNLPVGVEISAVSLSGGGLDVTFKRLTGETNESGSVTVTSGSLSETVTIHGTGLIE